MVSPCRKPDYDETLIEFATWTGEELARVVPEQLFPEQVLGTVTFAFHAAMAKHAKIPLVGQKLIIPALYSDDDWEAVCPDKKELLCSNPVCQGFDGKCTTSLMSAGGEGCECDDCGLVRTCIRDEMSF